MSKRNPNLIPIFAASEQTGLPVVVIDRLCHRGQVRSQRISGKLHVDRKSLEKFVRRQPCGEKR